MVQFMGTLAPLRYEKEFAKVRLHPELGTIRTGASFRVASVRVRPVFQFPVCVFPQTDVTPSPMF